MHCSTSTLPASVEPSDGANRTTAKARCVIAGGLLATVVVAMVSAASHVAAEPPSSEVWQSIGGLEVLGPGPDYVSIGVGAFDVAGERQAPGVKNRSAAGRIEYRRGREKLYFIGPMLGVMANTDGAVYGYGGIHAEAAYGNFVLTQFGAAGGYRKGNSKDLGGVFEFRLGVGFNWQLADRSRVGVEVVHMSNGFTHYINPGEEELYVTFALPF